MLTDFQNTCDEAVRRLLDELGASSDREYLEGQREEMLRYTVNDFTLWIYEDGAEIQGPNTDNRYERYGFDNLSELQARFLDDLKALVKSRE